MAVKDRTFKILQSQHAEQSLNNEDIKLKKENNQKVNTNFFLPLFLLRERFLHLTDRQQKEN